MPVATSRAALAVLSLSSLVVCACGQFSCGVGIEPVTQSQSGAAAEPAAAAVPDESDRPKVVVLGDSLTAGYGLLESQAYPSLLQEKIDAEGYDVDVVNAGVSGDTSAGGVRRLDWALDGNVRVLIVALGANDGLRGLPIEEMKQNLTEMVKRGRERGAVVVLAGMEAPPNYGPEYATAFRRAYREIAQRERVLFLPFLLDKVAGEGSLNQPDGIHPNAAGARLVAENVWSVLRPLLDQMAAGS